MNRTKQRKHKLIAAILAVIFVVCGLVTTALAGNVPTMGEISKAVRADKGGDSGYETTAGRRIYSTWDKPSATFDATTTTNRKYAYSIRKKDKSGSFSAAVTGRSDMVLSSAKAKALMEAINTQHGEVVRDPDQIGAQYAVFELPKYDGVFPVGGAVAAGEYTKPQVTYRGLQIHDPNVVGGVANIYAKCTVVDYDVTDKNAYTGNLFNEKGYWQTAWIRRRTSRLQCRDRA